MRKPEQVSSNDELIIRIYSAKNGVWTLDGIGAIVELQDLLPKVFPERPGVCPSVTVQCGLYSILHRIPLSGFHTGRSESKSIGNRVVAALGIIGITFQGAPYAQLSWPSICSPLATGLLGGRLSRNGNYYTARSLLLLP